MDAHVKREWLTVTVGWTAVILFLTLIDISYDWWVPEKHELNNHPLWALQEWGIWYVLSALHFRFLTQSYRKNTLTKSKFWIGNSVLYLTAMVIQSWFDALFYGDLISYTLLYFAPIHPMVIFINYHVWQRLIQPLLPVTEHTANTSNLARDNAPEPTETTMQVEQNGIALTIVVSDILYLSAASNYVEIQTRTRRFLKRATLKELENQLPPTQFIRTHRSYLVNISEINRIVIKASGSGLVYLKSGDSVGLSKANKAMVKARLANVNIKDEQSELSTRPERMG